MVSLFSYFDGGRPSTSDIANDRKPPNPTIDY